MKNRITVITVIIIILAVFGIYLLAERSNTPKTPDIVLDTVKYSCDAGKSISAAYGTNGISLTLSDNRTLALPQVVSASGARYEEGNVAFITKGENAFLQENDITTYDNCIANLSGDAPATNGTKTFTDSGQTFSFAYPEAYDVTGGGVGYDQNWRVNTQTLGLTLAKLHVPKEYMPNTNFSEATLTVGTSSDANAVKTCLTDTGGAGGKGTTVTINGVQYTKLTMGDAGAGNFYNTTSYRVVRNKQCYAIEYTIHSTNIGAYDPSQGITEFDNAKVTSLLEGIAQSFTFLGADQGAGASVSDALLGKWTGVEGTMLTVSKVTGGYNLAFVMLDGPVNATGTAAATGITFTRDGKTYTLHKGSGKDTGMKYLVDKKDCVVVQQYEGYCKD